jgi:hypothetical protein
LDIAAKIVRVKDRLDILKAVAGEGRASPIGRI